MQILAVILSSAYGLFALASVLEWAIVLLKTDFLIYIYIYIFLLLLNLSGPLMK